jgi:hypothetical protein
MQDVKELIEQMEPAPDERGDWNAVVREAGRHRRPVLLRSIAGIAVAAAALFALVLAQPWQGDSPTFLERALAAVDDGPVLHVVLRGEWGGTLVDLETGDREPVYGENEIWYDFERDRMHSVTRLGGVVEYEELSEPREPVADVAALGREYRQSLENGTARIAGEGSVDGEPVAWIVIRDENLPDSADGKLHRWAEEIAVSRESYEPVALRQTRDGAPGPGTLQRVQELEMLPSGQGDFSASKDLDPNGMVFMEGREPISFEEAADVLGDTPLWLGREHDGLPLAAAFRTSRKMGRQEPIRITGELEQKALACSKFRGEAAGSCFRALGRHPLEVRPDGVFTRGETVWEREDVGLQFFYGTVGDEPSTYRQEDDVPLIDRPYVTIGESTHLSPLRRGVSRYVPPQGSLFIAAGGHMGAVAVDGVYVSIQASSEELMLSAARALRAMPS